MKQTSFTAALIISTTLALTAAAQAEEGPFLVRVRALDLRTANQSDAIPALGVAADKIDVSSKWIPDIDLEYYFAPDWSSELVLTVPQSHDVSVAGVGNIGSFKQLPPTLTAKYHFNSGGSFSPYLGAGLNLTLIMDVNLAVPGSPSLPLKLDNHSVGGAVQAGFDIKLAEHWSANFDAKYVQIHSDVKLADGTKVSAVQVNPLLVGVGVAYRF
jgi:outer membrane protein